MENKELKISKELLENMTVEQLIEIKIQMEELTNRINEILSNDEE